MRQIVEAHEAASNGTAAHVPARIATSARRLTLYLPQALALGDRLDPVLRAGQRTTTSPRGLTTQQRGPATQPPRTSPSSAAIDHATMPRLIGGSGLTN